ncbi:MAG: type II toxin-antitoxin system YafQ family toxin [Lachnospiraceae bacterium]|nr:type II toxin-antitoxin system YafQ family toxin [Lachnospiraceae bacterium]
MLKVNTSGQFKKDLKTCAKRGYNLQLLEDIVDVLRIPDKLPDKNKEHYLTGNYKGRKECHITPDWLLIYEMFDSELYLVRTGTHSDLFKR